MHEKNWAGSIEVSFSWIITLLKDPTIFVEEHKGVLIAVQEAHQRINNNVIFPVDSYKGIVD